MNRARKKGTPVSELSRDMYGFLLKPQHLQRYREFASIYKEEEAERSERWEKFLRTYSNAEETLTTTTNGQVHKQEADEEQTRIVLRWRELKPSLCVVEQEIAARGQVKTNSQDNLETVKTRKDDNGGSDEESDDEFYDLDKTDSLPSDQSDTENPAPLEKEDCPWREELRFLVQGGVPMALRGELWQVFVRTKARRVEGHYDVLLSQPTSNGNANANGGSHGIEDSSTVEKYASQIEKDLPRTFPGHPALDEDGRNALRRLLTAYARHNPDVGYCQAMNFFAGLLLLLMPEENAFWTLAGIIDDYFNGYYSDKLLEAQVDQLVFEELAREYFPRLVSHLESIGVQIPWISGPWFLSIFVNVLPWESVLRVWDVLLFEGNRTMLFRTALALMELHAPALMATRDTADFISLMQNLAGATFDSSQLVLTACMGFQRINEQQLESLRTKHRPVVLATLDERASELQLWRSSQAALAKKLSRKHTAPATGTGSGDLLTASSLDSDMLENEIIEEVDDEDLEERDSEELVLWLKSQLCLALDEKRRAVTRAEELDVALMELVKEDNRRELSAKVEMLEAELAVVKQMLSDKQEQERAMVQVMLRMEQEQKMAEDARRYAENEAAVQQQAAKIYEEKYVKAMEELEAEKKRAVMAETMLEATLQYEAGQPGNARKQSKEEEPSKWSWPLSSPKTVDAAASKTKTGSVADAVKTASSEEEPRKGLFSRINWRDKNKAKVESVSQASPEAKVDSALQASPENHAAQEELKPTPGVDQNHNPASSVVEGAVVDETSSTASELSV